MCRFKFFFLMFYRIQAFSPSSHKNLLRIFFYKIRLSVLKNTYAINIRGFHSITPKKKIKLKSRSNKKVRISYQLLNNLENQLKTFIRVLSTFNQFSFTTRRIFNLLTFYQFRYIFLSYKR